MVIMLVSPVGPYFKNGFNPIKVAISREYDRVAPKGTGSIKIGGNYAASLNAGQMAHKKGYGNMLYLDPANKEFIDECGAANFFAIKDNTYITPASETVLPSITNMSLEVLAKDLGHKVERRPVKYAELAEFEEASACGTAAVCSPIGQIDNLDNGESFVYAKDGKAGKVTTELYNTLRGIQYGELPDEHGWCEILDLD